jgi:hypothetical protein
MYAQPLRCKVNFMQSCSVKCPSQAIEVSMKTSAKQKSEMKNVLRLEKKKFAQVRFVRRSINFNTSQR